MATVWQHYGYSMATVWLRYANGMATVWHLPDSADDLSRSTQEVARRYRLHRAEKKLQQLQHKNPNTLILRPMRS